MQKTKLLIISLYYPPVQSIASNRIASFTKYLNPDMFDIDVITVQTKDSLAFEKKENISIYRVAQNPFDGYLKIDQKIPFLIRKFKALYNILLKKIRFKQWYKKTLQQALKFQEKKHYDIILSSYAPVESHLIVLEFKKVYSYIPWIADMRDEMSLNPFLEEGEVKRLAKIEQQIFQYAHAITSVSQPILDDFKTLAKERASDIIFREIRNGYDFELNQFDTSQENSKFTISYVGSFYGIIKPDNFLKGVEQLISRYNIIDIHIRFVGHNGIINIPNNLKDKVELIGFVSHQEALTWMSLSDALLLIHPNVGRKGVYTGKLFEYLGMQKPIIALVDKSDVASALIQEAHAGFVAEESDMDEIVSAIYKAYELWKNKKQLDFNLDIIKQHHRKAQAHRLAKLIEEIKDK